MKDSFSKEIVRVSNLTIGQLRDEWCLCTLDTYTKQDVLSATSGASRGELVEGILSDWLERNYLVVCDEPGISL